jgi:hypothetical protein
MSLILHAAEHLIAVTGAPPRAYFQAAGIPAVPDPAIAPPPGLTGSIDTILGWVKWGSMIAGTIGLTVCAVMMMVGRRGRSSSAAEGAAGIPWVLLGLMLASAGPLIVGVFL